MLDRLPAAERVAWLRKLQRPNYRFTLDETPSRQRADAVGIAQTLAANLNAELGPGRVLGVGVEDPSRTVFSLRLADGTPLTLHLMTPRKMVSTTTALLLALQLAMVGGCVWWGVRLATRPLSDLASAATRLGDDPQAAELPEQGPAEVRRAIAAFNTMQRRIAAHLAERLQILAAVSHDLQTPITRMRVRTDLMPDEALRDKLQADLLDMQHLVEEGLAYARTAHAAMEQMQSVDLQALLDGLVCDYRDAARQVELLGPSSITLSTRPQALKRIVMNLVDHALKFAGEAQVVVSQSDSALFIDVLDQGPGMPDNQLLAVLQPFYRVEASRNRDTGGSGLGLAIAHRLSGALGATLSLHNRPRGGLQARLALPRQG
jgi:signal transduction histidine kinase